MNEQEQQAAILLAGVRFIPGSYPKRFAQDMANYASESPDKELSPKQRRYLWQCVVHYRRQLPSGLVALARKMGMTESDWLSSSNPLAMLNYLRDNDAVRPGAERHLLDAVRDRGEHPDGGRWVVSEALGYGLGVDPERSCALIRCIFGNPFRTNSLVALPCPRCGVRGPCPCDYSTPTVRDLAQVIYERRAWDEMPILADALEEAGCTDAAILMHLRDWVRCPACLGTRLKSHEGEGPFGCGTVTETCHDCQGGLVRPRCPACGGSGNMGMTIGKNVILEACYTCRGTGHAPAVHCRGCWCLDLILGKS